MGVRILIRIPDALHHSPDWAVTYHISEYAKEYATGLGGIGVYPDHCSSKPDSVRDYWEMQEW